MLENHVALIYQHLNGSAVLYLPDVVRRSEIERLLTSTVDSTVLRVLIEEYSHEIVSACTLKVSHLLILK